MRRFQGTVLLIIAFAIFGLAMSLEVPMQKAIPPLMDPIPTLPDITNRVYFEIAIDGNSIGKIVFGLFGLNSPDAVQNFLLLVQCKQLGRITQKPLCYRNTIFHRVIPNFAIQGGDITHGDGTGGETALSKLAMDINYHDGKFSPTMKELVKFNRPYMLAIAAKQRAGSQFFITTVKTQWLTGKHVIFGTVLEGKDVLETIEQYGTYGGIPKASISIIDCREQPLQPQDKERH